jgi:hypothetical protein
MARRLRLLYISGSYRNNELMVSGNSSSGQQIQLHANNVTKPDTYSFNSLYSVKTIGPGIGIGVGSNSYPVTGGSLQVTVLNIGTRVASGTFTCTGGPITLTDGVFINIPLQ